MRILVTIPHAFLGEGGSYGSERSDKAIRGAALLACLSHLHQTFGQNHRLLGAVPKEDSRCNTAQTELWVLLVTSGDLHLASTVPPGLAHHMSTPVPPRSLGFACHTLLRNNLGRFDWYGYLEDDLALTDGLFFDKLAWFNATFGPDVMLMPNRFETALPPVPKLYIDGAMQDGLVPSALQDLSARPRLTATALAREYAFTKSPNPHAGCFFASAAQMARMAAHPDYGKPADSFVGPLESAATLPAIRSFHVYKPAPENATFLEVRHIDQRVLGHSLRYSLDGNIMSRELMDSPSG